MANYQIPTFISEITGKSVEDYAKSQTSSINDYNNQLMQQYEKIAESQKNALNLNKQNAINEINNQRSTVNQNALQEAKQAYINKMLAQKDMKQTLSQSGLSTTGTTGTAYGSINNSYGENLNNITINKNNALRDIDNQINSTNLTYAGKEQELLADIAAKRLELSQNNSARYQQAYQQAVDNYMKYKDYEAQLTSLYQTQQQIENSYAAQQREHELALKNYELARQKINNAVQQANSTTSNYQALLQELLSKQNSNTSKNSVPEYKAKSSNSTVNKVNSNISSGRNPLIGVGLRDAVNFNKTIGRW